MCQWDRVDAGDGEEGQLRRAQYSDDVGKFVKHAARYGGDLLSIASEFSGEPGKEQGSSRRAPASTSPNPWS